MYAALLAIWAFPGCDTTIAFAEKGKTKIFRLASQNDCLRIAMTRVGCSLAPTECEKFVCHLYGLPTCTSVKEVRYELFRMECSKAQQMPPTQDALRQHLVVRVNYQSFVWKMICALCRICLVRTVTDGLLKLMKTVLVHISAG